MHEMKKPLSRRHPAPSLLRAAMLASVLTFGAGTAFADAAVSFTAPDKAYSGQVRLSSATRGQPVLAGSEVAISGRGFKPDQKITLLRGATPLNAEAFVADKEGNFQGKFTLPADAAVGTHPLIVATDAPYNAEVVDLKVSPKLPLSGEEKFKTTEARHAPGVYQTAYSAKNDALFVTTAVGRPPVKTSELLKLDPATLEVKARVTPAAAPAPQGGPGGSGGPEGEGGPREGGVYAVYGVAVDDANDTVWVTNTRQNTVAVYKQSDLSLVKQFEPGAVPHPRDVAIDGKDGKAYASPVGVSQIVVFDTKTLEPLKPIELKSRGRGKSFSPTSLKVDETTGKLFAVSMSTNELAVIDMAGGKVDKIIPVPGVRTAMGVAYDPETGRAFVAGQGSDSVVIVDVKSGEVVKDVAVGAGALNAAFDPVKKLAYVSSRDAGTVTVLDVDGNIVANLDQSPFANHVAVGPKGTIYSVNKSANPDDTKGDRIVAIHPAN